MQVSIQKILFVFICSALFLSDVGAQNWYLSPAVEKLIFSQCRICLQRPHDSALLLLSEENNGTIASSFHNSHIALKKNDLDEGYQYVLKTITAADNKADHLVYTYALFLKARILYYKNALDEPLAEYLHLLKLKNIDRNILSNVYSNIGEIYAAKKDFSTALSYFTAWQSLFLSITEPLTIRKIYNNTATCFLHLNNYTDAAAYYKKSRDISIKLKDTAGLAVSYINTANLYYNLFKDDSAFINFRKALRYATISKDIEKQKDVYKSLAVVEEGRKNYKEALAYRKQFEIVNDSLWNRDALWKLAQKEQKIVVQERDYRLQLARKRNELQAVALSKQQTQRNSFLALAVLFLSFAAFLWVAYIQKAKRNRIIAAQKEELDQLNHTKDQLFSIISHDLRSPVSGLKGNIGKLRKAVEQNNPVELRRTLGLVEQTSNTTYALLNNLLHWALSQTNQLNYLPQRLQAKAVTDQVCYDFAPVAAAKSISLHNHVSGDLHFTADINAVKIILRNLIDNAIKYTNPHGEICITARQTPAYCCLIVKDNGIGMNEDLINRIITNSNKRIQEDASGNRSTGLGLCLSRNIITQNGGGLYISSNAGKGTEVTIELPLAQAL